MNIRVDHKGHCLYGSEPTGADHQGGRTRRIVKINWDLYHMHISEGDLCGHLKEGFDADRLPAARRPPRPQRAGHRRDPLQPRAEGSCTTSATAATSAWNAGRARRSWKPPAPYCVRTDGDASLPQRHREHREVSTTDHTDDTDRKPRPLLLIRAFRVIRGAFFSVPLWFRLFSIILRRSSCG